MGSAGSTYWSATVAFCLAALVPLATIGLVLASFLETRWRGRRSSGKGAARESAVGARFAPAQEPARE